MTRCKDVKMTGWQDDWMTRKRMTRQQDDKSCQMLPEVVNYGKNAKIGKRCQTLLNIVKRCWMLPTGIKNIQSLQQEVRNCQKFPTGIGKSWQKLPKIDECWMLLKVGQSRKKLSIVAKHGQKVAKSCQILPKVVKSTQKLTKVPNCWQTLSKAAKSWQLDKMPG